MNSKLNGIILCLILALPAWKLGKEFPVVGGPVFGIIIGVIVALILKNRTKFDTGISFVSKKVLQYAVILLGFGLDSDAIHSPNEHYGIFNFLKGIETIPWFYHYFVNNK